MTDADLSPSPSAAASGAAYREVKFRHSRDFVPLFDTLGATLLVSTYQAGKLVAVGASQSGVTIRFNNFDQAMGIAVHPDRLAVGSRGAIWFLENAGALAARLEPAGRYDACYLARRSFITGNIHAHEMAWAGDELWIVNTLFSCLCTLHEDFSFVPRWQPRFITELAPNDRCHLNGIAFDEGRPKYVTVMAESNEPGGWRPTKAHSGRILDVDSGQAVTQGLAMPHSPRVHDGKLWVLHSGAGNLEIVDPRTGQRDVVAKMPGYTRGLAFCGNFAFVGLSRIRETAVFGGVPIAERREELKCAVAVVDLRSGQNVAYLEFESGVEEIFDVQVLTKVRAVSITGPWPLQDDAQDVWLVPPPEQVPRLIAGSAATAGRGSAVSRPSVLSDDEVAALVRRGLDLHREGRFEAAVETLRQASAARPQSPEVLNHLGNAWQDFGRQDLAFECYERAVAVRQTYAPAHQNFGYLLINYGRFDEGLAHLARAQQLQPDDVNRVMLATSLPVVYESVDDVRRHRERIEANVQRLVDEGASVDASGSTIPTNFFAAYQGYNDRDLQQNLSRIYRAPQLVEPGRRRDRAGRIRVGFLSAHFCNHTIGRLNLGRVEHLDREQFEVTVIARGHHQDEMAQAFRTRADHYVELTSNVEAARRRVADLPLDVLVFTDVGMNALTYTLALSRLAPVQCVTWGHPVTTGNASMDYFISSELLETADADRHYTEQLVRLANLGTYYYRPALAEPRLTRASFGLDPARHVYLCPQTLFKLHPEFDVLLAEILRRDPQGDVVLIEGRQPWWMRLLKERFARTMPDVAARVRFLPPQPHADYLQLNAVADVVLDTIHFGGGNTSYEAIALGTPIVTLPGPYLRSRITLALYRKLQVMDCVVDSAQRYVNEAARLGTDADYRRAISEKILGVNHVLFEDLAEIRELERFLAWAAEGGHPKPFPAATEARER